MSMVWALIPLHPDVTPRYFEVVDLDTTGRPKKLAGIYDKSFLISQSTLNTPQILNNNKPKIDNTAHQLHYINPRSSADTWEDDRAELTNWLLSI